MLKRTLIAALLALFTAAPLTSAHAVVREEARREEAKQDTRKDEDRAGRDSRDAREADEKGAKAGKAFGELKAVPAHEIAADFSEIKKAVHEVRIIDFMIDMAEGKTLKVGTKELTFEQVKEVWDNKQDSLWLEDEFRAVRKNDHEFIPSNEMIAVIERAQKSPEKLSWIHLQDLMRVSTEDVIFSPAKGMASRVEKNGQLVLQGHSGALDGPSVTVGQADFHNELREAFVKAKTVSEAISGCKKVAQKWIWDGTKPDLALDPRVKFHGGGSVATKDVFAKQKASYEAVMKMFDGVAAQVQAADKADQAPQAHAER